MIAILLAAALQLTPTQLQQKLDIDPSYAAYRKITADLANRDQICMAEGYAQQLAGDLRQALAKGQLLVITDFPHSAEYNLSPDDRKVVEARAIQLETEAANYRIKCGS